MSQPNWYLEGIDTESDNRRIVRTPVRALPFVVGRRGSCDLPLPSKMVSQRHAEFFARGDELWLRDLGSTNGTFINGTQLRGEHAVRDGDILHFANLEYRLVADEPEPSWLPVTQTVNLKEALAPGAFKLFKELRDMIEQRDVQAYFQPLVTLDGSQTVGYEVLGRGLMDGEVIPPGRLFEAAETLGLAEQLSDVFRNRGMEEALGLPSELAIFLNTHPQELKAENTLVHALRMLREHHPERDVVLEIHESAVASGERLLGLRRELDLLKIRVAFDDFGTGQARLAELAAAAPDFLKFDVAFIRGIHQASKQHRDMVGALVRLARDMGVVTIAEGVEEEEEAQVCRELGFEWGQGYFLGRPAPISTFLD